MRVRVDRRTGNPFAAHGSSGRSAHWLTNGCPIERGGGYRCVDDGIVHDSEVRTEQYRLLSRAGELIGAPVAAAITDSVISLAALEPVMLEHSGAYVDAPSRRDEAPVVLTRAKGDRYVIRIRGCRRYRRLVADTFGLVEGVRLARP